VLDRKPDKKTASLINTRMGKMIIGQAIAQLAITFTLHFCGAKLMGYNMSNEDKAKHLKTLLTGTFDRSNTFYSLGWASMDLNLS
jgi:Ca2+-transporting ATPase